MAPSRIDELRRRVQSDPASIAFAQLAEEYRRSGQTEEAVRVSREGLTRHPGYLSARVTLGRALLDLGQLLGAREELEFVVAEAPENLAAVRGLAEIAHREGQTTEALTYYQRALALARHDPEIEEIVQQLSRQLGAAAAGPSSGLSFEEAHQELLSAAERLPVIPPPAAAADGRDADQGSTAPFDFDRLVAALGTPSAPPQLEAAVDGRASTVSLDLPEPVSLGPDPFAALEAELRASDAARDRITSAPWPPLDEAVTDEPYALDAAVELTTTGDVLPGTSAVTELPTRGPAVAAWVRQARDGVDLGEPMSDFASLDDAPAALAQPAQPVEAAEPSEYDLGAVALAAVPEPEPAPAPAREPAQEPAKEPAEEGVLDELESWLTTLQDRSSH